MVIDLCPQGVVAGYVFLSSHTKVLEESSSFQPTDVWVAIHCRTSVADALFLALISENEIIMPSFEKEYGKHDIFIIWESNL